MATYFESANSLALLHKQLRQSAEVTQYLFKKVGVRSAEKKIVILTISEGETVVSSMLMMTIMSECESLYGKQIDLSLFKVVSISGFEKAKRTPYLEQADFIIVTDKDLLEAQTYPELEHILFP